MSQGTEAYLLEGQEGQGMPSHVVDSSISHSTFFEIRQLLLIIPFTPLHALRMRMTPLQAYRYIWVDRANMFV